METRILATRVAAILLAILLAACSSSTAPESNVSNELPDTFPPIPRPSTLGEIVPDTSEVYTDIVPIEGVNIDFAPTWTAGVFTWNIDVQTQYQKVLGGNTWYGDPPGNYYDGTAHNSTLVFESGVVDLRSPTPYGTSFGDPYPRRVLFVRQGTVLAEPVNPEQTTAFFNFVSAPDIHIQGALFNGYVTVEKTPAFGQTARRAAYYVAAVDCPLLSSPVFIKRERFWVRVPLVQDGDILKSINVDPGASFSVQYMRTHGTSYSNSYTFTRAINAELGLDVSAVGGKLGGSLSEAFETTVSIQEQTSVTVTRSITGIPDKTLVYAVWATIERYSIVHEDGTPYTDPKFTFKLGSADIKGEYEWISSTPFDYP